FLGANSLGGSCEYRIFLTLDPRHPQNAAGTGVGRITGMFSDASSLAPFTIYGSSPLGGQYQLEVLYNYFQSGDVDVFGLYSWAPIQLTLCGNRGNQGLGWINYTTTGSYLSYWNPYIAVVGPDLLLSQAAGSVKINNSLHVDY